MTLHAEIVQRWWLTSSRLNSCKDRQCYSRVIQVTGQEVLSNIKIELVRELENDDD